MQEEKIEDGIYQNIIKIISETNGISISDTIELLKYSPHLSKEKKLKQYINEFDSILKNYHHGKIKINELFSHPFSKALYRFLKDFPLKYNEEHIHLTGSLSAKFIYPRLKKILEGPHGKEVEKKIANTYGPDSIPITSESDVDKLIRLQDGEQFTTYLKILFLPKIILVDRKAHQEAAYHMAQELYKEYNVGKIRLKFTLSRATANEDEQIPGTENVTEEDVVLGLYDGFKQFQKEMPDFNFILSPSFRKEPNFFDTKNYTTKEEHFLEQVKVILDLIAKFPFLSKHLIEVDTVGDEKALYRKKDFAQMKSGLRRLQYNGFYIRSHHGETWKNLRLGVQSVDNAMNIWHIDTLEHGLSLGVNPNYYFHRLYQRIMEINQKGIAITSPSKEYFELEDMTWSDKHIFQKLKTGVPLTKEEETSFVKTKFHQAREVEHYQHDVLNRMINKKVSLVALPSSNMKLTGCFPDYKDHPFSWWEKKGVKLGVGTDNYITLNTNYIKELMILLYSDPNNLKITKLLMVATKENRRPYLSHFLWEMRKKTNL